MVAMFLDVCSKKDVDWNEYMLGSGEELANTSWRTSFGFPRAMCRMSRPTKTTSAISTNWA
jgi:hypothetical protein